VVWLSAGETLSSSLTAISGRLAAGHQSFPGASFGAVLEIGLIPSSPFAFGCGFRRWIGRCPSVLGPHTRTTFAQLM